MTRILLIVLLLMVGCSLLPGCACVHISNGSPPSDPWEAVLEFIGMFADERSPGEELQDQWKEVQEARTAKAREYNK